MVFSVFLIKKHSSWRNAASVPVMDPLPFRIIYSDGNRTGTGNGKGNNGFQYIIQNCTEYTMAGNGTGNRTRD